MGLNKLNDEKVNSKSRWPFFLMGNCLRVFLVFHSFS